MNATILQGPGKLKVAQVPIPQVSQDEVLIRIKATGICGTDLLVYQGRYASSYPVIPGHEFAGVVDQVGAEVAGLREGDRVSAEASWGCGVCLLCQQGEVNLCQNRVSLGRTRNGSFAEYVAVPARAVHKLPPSVTFEQAQALVTIACAIRAVRRGRPDIGEKVAIFGPGVSGLILLQIALLSGAPEVAVFGTRDWRLEFAQKLGATGIVNVRQDTWAERARELTKGHGFDLAFEASGNPEALSQSLQMLRNGGRTVVYSIYESPTDRFPVQAFYAKEVTIVGSRGGAGGYVPGLDLLGREQLRLDLLTSHRLPLGEAKEGFALMERRDERVLRVVLVP